ncbi:MAG: PAC2 family protein [Dehalococcoidia bacterium]
MSPGLRVRSHRTLKLHRSSLVLGWSTDGGNLAGKTTGYLNLMLKGQAFAEIEPDAFFSLDGVAVKEDVARFPESRFHACLEHDLVVFQGNPPEAEWYLFLNSILDVAEQRCGIEELYTIGAMVSFSAHTAPRQLITVVNSPEMKEALAGYDLLGDMDYQTPPGERPTLNAFLLWIARERNIPGVNLWVPMPFYLAGLEDVQAQKKVLSFLDERLQLRIDFSDLDRKIREQNERLARARSQSPEVDGYIGRLERNLMLSEEENGELVRRIEEFVREGD